MKGTVPGNCLALAELEALAGTGLTGLLALTHARVAGQKTLGLQGTVSSGLAIKSARAIPRLTAPA